MSRKSVSTFLLHVAFLVTLIAFIPGTRETTAAAVHAVGNAMFGSLSEGHSVRFKPPDVATRRGRADTNMLGRTAGTLENEWRVTFSSYRRLFWPLATLAALMLATPMPRRRLAWALPFPLAVFFAFYMLELVVFATVVNGARQPVTAGESSLWRDLLPVVQAMFNSPITNFSLIFLLWAMFGAPMRGIDTERFEATLRRLFGPARARPAQPVSEDSELQSEPPPTDPEGSER